MRVLQLTPSYSPVLGGLEAHVESISRALRQRGHEVLVATMTRDDRSSAVDAGSGVALERFPAHGPRAFAVSPALAAFVRTRWREFDVVHAHNYYTLPPLLAALHCPRKAVLTPHLHDAGRGATAAALRLRVPYDAVIGRLQRRVAAVACVSAAEAALARRRLGIDDAVVVPNIVELAPPDAAPPAVADRCSTPGRWLLAVGRLEAYKGVGRLITCLPWSRETEVLVVVGDGPERVRLERLAHDLGVGARVAFTGRITDGELSWLYARAAAVAALSEAEAFGRTVIEGVVAGCSVLCSDIPAHREAAAEFPGRVALVPSTTAGRDLAAEIDRVLRAAVREPVATHRFTTSRVGEALERVYADVSVGAACGRSGSRFHLLRR